MRIVHQVESLLYYGLLRGGFVLGTEDEMFPVLGRGDNSEEGLVAVHLHRPTTYLSRSHPNSQIIISRQLLDEGTSMERQRSEDTLRPDVPLVQGVSSTRPVISAFLNITPSFTAATYYYHFTHSNLHLS
jgi:hypothetical protein